MMKIKIISDGDPMFTRVINAETDELLPVVAVKWEMDIRKRPYEACQAWVLLDGIELEAEGLTTISEKMVKGAPENKMAKVDEDK